MSNLRRREAQPAEVGKLHAGPGFQAEPGDRIQINSEPHSGYYVVTDELGPGSFAIRPETRWERFVRFCWRPLQWARRALR